MNTFDLKSVITDLESDSTEAQVLAIEAATEIVNNLVEKALETFQRSPDRLFIAERLANFGVAIVAPLEKLTNDSNNLEVIILASLVLLQLGSKVGVRKLLDAFLESDDYACLIARHMVKANIDGFGDNIVTRLRLCEIEQDKFIVCLLEELKKLNYDLPSDLYSRFSDSHVSADIQYVVRNFNKN